MASEFEETFALFGMRGIASDKAVMPVETRAFRVEGDHHAWRNSSCSRR